MPRLYVRVLFCVDRWFLVDIQYTMAEPYYDEVPEPVEIDVVEVIPAFEDDDTK